MILVLPRSVCTALVTLSLVPWDAAFSPALTWRARDLVETDPDWLQVIPYAVLIDLADRPWAYRRTGGDDRLRARCSIGVGGHVEQEDDRGDLLPTVRAALARELAEELAAYPRTMAGLIQPIAWINEQKTAIGRVHLGLVFALPWGMADPPQPRRGEGLEAIGFVDPTAITSAAGYEDWSLLARDAVRGRS